MQDSRKMYLNRFRYVLLVLTFFCLISICCNYIIINFTFICMQKDTSDMYVNDNGTLVNRYDYSQTEKSMIIWAVAIGTIIGTFPVNYSYIRYGARWPFFIAGMLSASSTVLLPFAAHLGLPYMLILRFMQGLAYSADFAAIGIVCVRWAPLSETGLFIAVLTSFTPVSTVVSNPVSAWMCDSSLGWRASFYVHAIFGFVVFLLWIWLYNDDPQIHRNVSEKELGNIQLDKTKAHIERDSFVPYKEIIKNKVILVVWLNAFVEMVTAVLLLTYAPLYFHQVLGYDIATTGLLVSLIASVHLPLKFVGGIISDKISFVSERIKMCFFNTFAVGLAGVSCLLIGFFETPSIAVLLFGGVITAMGLNPGGFYKCGTLVSRQYAHFVLATIQFMKCVALFVGPLIMAIFVHDEHSYSQWSYVFFINAGALIIANCLFYPISTVEPAAFTHITSESRRREKEQQQEGIRCASSTDGSTGLEHIGTKEIA